VRIFGIDPGSERTGYGCIETDGSCHRIVACGAISSPSAATFPEKLLTIHSRLAVLIGDCRPDCVAIENLFHATNVRSALKLGHARGVAMLAAVEAGLQVVEYTPAEIKRAVVGYGRAEKHQVAQMVKLILGLTTVPTPHDAADALAVAICHVHSRIDLRSCSAAPHPSTRARGDLSEVEGQGRDRGTEAPRYKKAATSWRHYKPARP
jgi:crossover junction endodeoxyribonuclease RuvC